MAPKAEVDSGRLPAEWDQQYVIEPNSESIS